MHACLFENVNIGLQGVLQKESDKSKEAFQLKDSDKIVISKTGTLKIQCTGKGFELIEKNDAVIEFKHLPLSIHI